LTAYVTTVSSLLRCALPLHVIAQVATGVELYVAPASSQVQQEAERLGYWNELIVAGYAERRGVA